MKIHVKLLLLLIVIVAILMRFYHLGINPPSLTWDEVAWGYNAYSLGTDGRDEFGRFLPYDYLESFGDFKPPMYAYLDVIPVKLFGLTPFATRFPSALFGSLSILITFFLVKRIFYSSKFADHYSLVSAGILAISPWHVMLSRAAFEANIATFFLITGVLLFLKGITDKGWYLSLSAASFVLSVYTFNSARVVAPLLVILLSIGFYKTLWRKKQAVLVAAVVGICLVLPIAKFLLSPQASLRFKEVNIFSDVNIVKHTNQEISNDGNAWWSRVIHNRRLAYAGEFIHHYFDNLRPGFLFIRGDGNPKFSTQDLGQMYLWDIPFFIAGILLLPKKREGVWWVVPLWLILGIVPAATARETPHALRTEATLPTFQIFVAYGFVAFFTSPFYKKFTSMLRVSIIAAVYIILLLNVLYFQHGYYVYYPKKFSGEWQYGYNDSINFASRFVNNYDRIQVTDGLGRPYIYYLFFTKTDPKYFRSTAKINRDPFGFVTVESFGKYHFVRSNNEKVTGKVLFIYSPIDVPENAHVLKTFYRLDGSAVLKAYTL